MLLGDRPATQPVVSPLDDWLEKFKKIGKNGGKPVGTQQIDSHQAKGFEVTQGTEKIIVWADAQSRAPLRAEVFEQLDGKEARVVTLDHIRLNEPLPDSLFSMAVPQGYAVRESTLKLSFKPATEDDLIAFFRAYTNRSGGKFPPVIGPHWGETIEAVMPKESKPTTQQVKDLLSFSEKLGRAAASLNSLSGGWHYVGKEVRLGEAGKPVFWYQPQGSPKARVIYGDLHIGEASPKDLPASGTESSQRTSSIPEVPPQQLPPPPPTGSFK